MVKRDVKVCYSCVHYDEYVPVDDIGLDNKAHDCELDESERTSSEKARKGYQYKFGKGWGVAYRTLEQYESCKLPRGCIRCMEHAVLTQC